MDSADLDLPREIAASLVDPAEAAAAEAPEPPLDTPLAGGTKIYTPGERQRRRRLALTIGVATVVVGAGVGWAVVAALPAADHPVAKGPDSSSAPTGVSGSPASLGTDGTDSTGASAVPSSGGVSTAADQDRSMATGGGPSSRDAGAGGSANAQVPSPSPSPSPSRRGSPGKKDGLYWPSQL